MRRAGRPAGTDPARSVALAPDAAQPARQRRQVHGHRQRARHAGDRAVGRGRAAAARDRRRHGHRHQARGAGAAVRAVLAGRRLDDPPLRRHRPGPGHHPAARRADGRQGRRRERRGTRQRLLVHHPLRDRGRTAVRGDAARRAAPAHRGRSSVRARRARPRAHRARRDRRDDRLGGGAVQARRAAAGPAPAADRRVAAAARRLGGAERGPPPRRPAAPAGGAAHVAHARRGAEPAPSASASRRAW